MAQHDRVSLVYRPHTRVYINRAEGAEHRSSLFYALKFKLFEYTMETESESSTLGDDSVFWLDSEVITQVTDSEEGEREANFR